MLKWHAVQTVQPAPAGHTPVLPPRTMSHSSQESLESEPSHRSQDSVPSEPFEAAPLPLLVWPSFRRTGSCRWARPKPHTACSSSAAPVFANSSCGTVVLTRGLQGAPCAKRQLEFMREAQLMTEMDKKKSSLRNNIPHQCLAKFFHTCLTFFLVPHFPSIHSMLRRVRQNRLYLA